MFAAFSAVLLIIKWITLRCKSFLNDQSLYEKNLNEMRYPFGAGRHKRQADITLLFQYIYVEKLNSITRYRSISKFISLINFSIKITIKE